MPKAQGHIIVRRRPRNGNDGNDGEDGKGIEFIFTRTTQESNLNPPASQNYDDYVPSGWTDNQQGVTEYWKFEYVSKREKKYGNWGAFSKPKIWARWAKDGEPGGRGPQGIEGCIHRQSEWVEGVEYRNDEALISGLRYIDIAIVITGATTFEVYKCKKTHTSSSSIKYNNSTYWQKLNNMQPIYTPFIMAKNALLRFTQTNQLLVMKSDNSTVAAGMGGGNYPLWVGAVNPSNAPFKVSIDGKLTSTDADIKGIITATSGAIGGFTIEGGRLYWKQRDYFTDDSRALKLGVSKTDTEGIVDISFNAATKGRFGLKAVGSNMGGAAIYASKYGYNTPNINNTYAAFFDGAVHSHGTMYIDDLCIAKKYGVYIKQRTDGTYEYHAGVNWNRQVGSPDLDKIRLIVENGIITGYYGE